MESVSPMTVLIELRGKIRSTLAQLEQFQQAASQSIGVKDLVRQRGLTPEQGQLIRELRLLQEHIAQFRERNPHGG